ncbi:hypothetical protein Tsubulata_024089 [Turnera subulata]|uniref:DUF4283 domain-containing protein n=1 Tax=Turnera subulata TaxID=218843 RepID=A0A9Q0FK62_9ROSI|nr:hypothetical protein Tsubulata_024089 [Turnera subulata]
MQVVSFSNTCHTLRTVLLKVFSDTCRLLQECHCGIRDYGSRGPPRPPDPHNGVSSGVGARPSFKDKLMLWRTGVAPYRADDGFQLKEDDIRVEMKESGTSFQFSKRFRSHIACPWVYSVIAKVLGRRFSYRVICSKVASLWKPQGGFQVIDLAIEYYLIHFEKREDYNRVLAEGP